MKPLSIVKHIIIVATGVFLILGLPFLCTDYFRAWASGDVDVVSSATVVLDQPSGNYVVFLNKAMHTDEDALEDWVTFFSGGDILYIWEDVSCSVAEGDTAGIEMAQSLQSQLPENQMTIREEDPTLLVSRMDNGKFDIVVMSQEFVDSYDVEATASDDTEVIYLISGEDAE